jgi:hypothetical protein
MWSSQVVKIVKQTQKGAAVSPLTLLPNIYLYLGQLSVPGSGFNLYISSPTILCLDTSCILPYSRRCTIRPSREAGPKWEWTFVV